MVLSVFVRFAWFLNEKLLDKIVRAYGVSKDGVFYYAIYGKVFEYKIE